MKEYYRVRIIQPVVLEYRVGLYKGLYEKYGERIDLWAAKRLGQDESVDVAGIWTDYGHPFVRIGPILWQKRLSLRGLEKGDVLVVCGDVKQLSSIALALAAKIRGIRVVWWGHHWSSTSKEWKVKIRLLVAKCVSDVYLCYTHVGTEYLLQHGFKRGRVYATGNTINLGPINDAIKAWDEKSLAKFRKENDLEGKHLLLISGVLRPKMNLEMLVSALADARLAELNVILAVVGDGTERESCLRLARSLNVDRRIIWLGATRDQNVLAPWFLTAEIYVYPGAIGLSILHSFSYGLPVVTHGDSKHQMPEFEAMEDGKTGLVFKEGDVEDLKAKILSLIANKSLLTQMKKYCMNKVYSEYSMSKMVENYIKAIEGAANV